MDKFSDSSSQIQDTIGQVGYRVRASAETLFVLGNGPSLKGVNLHELSGFACVGLNAAYRYWRDIDWRPTHYSCLDLVVGLSHIDAIEELIHEERIEHFLLRENLIRALGNTAYTKRITAYEDLARRDLLFADPTITTGSGAALWGAHLGFRDIVIAGVDGNYKEVVDGASVRDGIELEIVRDSENPNYFFDGYQKPGDRYNLPNPTPDLHANAWRIAARKIYSLTQSRILNANPKSEVQYFPTVKLGELLAGGSFVSEPIERMEQSVDLFASEASSADEKTLRQRVFAAEGKRMAIVLVGLIVCLVWAGQANSYDIENAFPIFVGTTFLAGLTMAFVYSRRALSLHLKDLQDQVTDLKAAAVHPEIEYNMLQARIDGTAAPHKFLSPLLQDSGERLIVDLRTFFAGDGWHHAEPHGRWAGKDDVASVCLSDLPIGSYEFEIEVVQSAVQQLEEEIELRFGSEVLPFDVQSAAKTSRLNKLRDRVRDMLLGARPTTFPALLKGQFKVKDADKGQPAINVLCIACKDRYWEAQKIDGESRNLTICVSRLFLKSISK